MAKINRIHQKVFAENSGLNELGKFGSLAAGSPEYVLPANAQDIQDLGNFEGGWFDAVIGNNSPAIQDMNGLFHLVFKQLAYIFQQGIPEYNSLTEYYENSMVMGLDGSIYQSLIDNNIGNPLTDLASWKVNLSSGVGQVYAFAGSTAPSGHLICDGAAVSRTNYSKLFNVIGEDYGSGDGSTTFNLPDLRGEFLRGLDNGRGVDSGRALGSSQSDATAVNGLATGNDTHNHTGTTSTNGNHSHAIPGVDKITAGGTFANRWTDGSGNESTADAGNHNHTFTTSNNTHNHSLSGDAETRPRNVAMNYIIKF